MPMRLSKFRKRFSAAGHAVAVEYDVYAKSAASRLMIDGVPAAGDTTDQAGKDLLRNHRLEADLADGRRLSVEIGPASTWGYGLHARIDGETVFETHPGRTLGYGKRMQAYVAWAEAQNTPAEKARHAAAWKRNWPSLAVDVAMAVAFFVVAKAFGLTAAAVSGAAAGLVLWVIQRLVKVDLLGGLAVFGIVMSLISAGFALAFDDPWLVQMRSTIIGVVGAIPFLLDGLTGGQRLAGRMARYLAFDVDAGRLGIGMGLVGLLMAGSNWLVVELLSEDAWLIYTTFLDVPVSVAGVVATMLWARKGPNARTY